MKKYLFNVPKLVFENRPWLVALFQASLVLSSLLLSWFLRFNFTIPFRRLLFASACVLLPIRLLTLRLFNLHRGWWHFSGVSDASRIVKAVILGAVLFVLLITIIAKGAFPRSVFFMETIITTGLLCGGRLISRVFAESMRQEAKSSRKVLLIGAGFAAQMVIREMAHSVNGCAVVGCVDDDKSKIGLIIHGVRVLGTVDQLPELARSSFFDDALIAVPSATAAQMQRFTRICRQAGVPFRTVPALSEIINGGVSVREFREVRLEDLLGREPVQIDLARVRRELDHKVVLITGAAGSIGSELCRQIVRYQPIYVVCVDQSETALFYLQQEIGMQSSSAQIVFNVADINDEFRMNAIFKQYKPNVVFHAAAYKHVPLMESNVQEAVKNNVFGLWGLLDIADRWGCENFVLISSDKAVNPTSVMGATKRIGELILACRDAGSMRCVSVRFGNVLGSNGSVIPVLRRQLEHNLPLTITHPEITRFFMTTQEAVSLVLEASAVGQHGEILVLEMGRQIPILELARTLVQLSGKRENQVSFRFTGLRLGEKLYEELHSSEEELLPTDCAKLRKIQGKFMDWAILARHLHELNIAMTIDGPQPVIHKIRQILPEYQGPFSNPAESSFQAAEFSTEKAHAE